MFHLEDAVPLLSGRILHHRFAAADEERARSVAGKSGQQRLEEEPGFAELIELGILVRALAPMSRWCWRAGRFVDAQFFNFALSRPCHTSRKAKRQPYGLLT